MTLNQISASNIGWRNQKMAHQWRLQRSIWCNQIYIQSLSACHIQRWEVYWTIACQQCFKKLARRGPFQHPPLPYQWLWHLCCNSPTDHNSEECSMFFFLALQTKKCSGRTYTPQKLRTFTLIFYHSHSIHFFDFAHALEYRNKFWTFSDSRWQNHSRR